MADHGQPWPAKNVLKDFAFPIYSYSCPNLDEEAWVLAVLGGAAAPILLRAGL